MNAKKILAAALVAVISMPAFVAAEQFDLGPKNEQVVEGHTVFALLEKQRQGTAVAVLVRENQPKVLWFNDQYLVGEEPRYPCGGHVMAVNEGDPDPRDFSDNGAAPNSYPSVQGTSVVMNVEYIESYRVVDPNDFAWDIDYYLVNYLVEIPGSNGDPLQLDRSFPIWAVSILNAGINDDGTSSCQPIVDDPAAGYLDPGLNGMCYSGGQYYDDGAQRCGPVTASCTGIADGYPDPATPPGTSPPVLTTPNGLTPVCDWPRLYNAVLFMFWEDLYVNDGFKEYGCSDADGDGVTDCSVGSADFGADNEDKNGCEEGPTDADEIQYDCVDDPLTADDDNEGNSHAYNPTLCDTNGDGVIGAGDTPCWGELHTHETARIDIYFDSEKRPPVSPVRNYVLFDTVGSAAPFHDHQGAGGTPTCPPGWINPGGGGYPGAPTPYCP